MNIRTSTIALLAVGCIAVGVVGTLALSRLTAPPTSASVSATVSVPETQGADIVMAPLVTSPQVAPREPRERPATVVPIRPAPPAEVQIATAPSRAASVEPQTQPTREPAPTDDPGTDWKAAADPSRPSVDEELASFDEPAAPRAEFEEVVVDAGVVVGLRIETEISSETARVEDRVAARVIRDLWVGDRVAVPEGARAIGVVSMVERGGRLRDAAGLGVVFSSIELPDGSRLDIDTDPVYREGDSPGNESATRIGVGAIGGAILGGILGGTRGAVIGGTAGAGAGTAAAMAGGRDPAILQSGSAVTIRVARPFSVVLQR